MKARYIIIFILLVVLTLSACQSSEDAPSDSEPVSIGEGESPVEEDAYPYPIPEVVLESNEPYPDPLFPDIADGAEASWEQVREMINNGEVRQITIEGVSPEIVFGLKDGRLLTTTTPVEELQLFLASCGDICKTIILIQE